MIDKATVATMTIAVAAESSPTKAISVNSVDPFFSGKASRYMSPGMVPL